MAKETKFGTFGGVFTPSILTILGVIMYLRLPWVVGSAGLQAALGIIIVAHVISVTTGLSISSIATDKNVGAGGPYYIVSRSLGLPIGGALGLALFVGLSFSISLYVVGFSESILGFLGQYFDIEVNKATIRICGTITILALTAITIISTALAIKTQYLILAFIGASLVVVFFGGSAEIPAQPHMQGVSDGPSLAEVFGVFFPAVTGFTAGVNMSGDLQNPKKAIPRGTMAAIAVGLIVYVGLAIFLGYRVNPDDLVNDTSVLLGISLFAPVVLAGIWGATLSSALGSILGAPRILQALAADRIGPRFLAKGTGKTKEPRNALLFAFALGEVGILIAELDAIARVVSMVFLTMYGVLNLSAAIESWASPDFRPEFKIPKIVSIIGAITCLLVMIQLDLLAMIGSSILMAGIFLYLQRRQLTLDTGDAWEGIWSSLVRSGLQRLWTGASEQQRRNWRPNVLLFSRRDAEGRVPLVEFATSLVSGRGIVTDFNLVGPDDKKPEGEAQPTAQDPTIGVFSRTLATEDAFASMTAASEFHGLPGMLPNTVMLDWQLFVDRPDQSLSFVERLEKLDHNFLLYARGGAVRAAEQRIDVWWRAGQGNVSLSILLMRFLTAAERWRNTAVRFLLVSDDSGDSDALQATAKRLIGEARLQASVRVIDNSLEGRELEEWVIQESGDAALVVAGLPGGQRLQKLGVQARLRSMVDPMHAVLLLRGSSIFPEVFASAKRRKKMQTTTQRLSALQLAPLDMPQTPDIAAAVDTFVDVHTRMVASFFDKGVTQLYERDRKLVQRIRDMVEKHFKMLERDLPGEGAVRRRRLVGKVQTAFVFQSRKQLAEFEQEEIAAQRATLEGRIEDLAEDTMVGPEELRRQLQIARSRDDFTPNDDDPDYLVSFKRRKRIFSWLRRGPVNYSIPLRRLEAFYLAVPTRDLFQRILRQFLTDSHRAAIALGKVLNSSKTSLTLIGDGLTDEGSVAKFLAEQREAALSGLDDLIKQVEGRLERHREALLSESHRICQEFADDADRLDAQRLIFAERRIPERALQVLQELRESPAGWTENQTLLVQRAQLGLQVAEFQHRLATIAFRTKSDLILQLRGSVLGECKKLLEAVRAYGCELGDEKSEPSGLAPDFGARFDLKQVVDDLLRQTQACTRELPESSTTLSDESIEHLEAGHEEDVEVLSVSVRPLIQFLVEAEFIGSLQERFATIPGREQRAMGVAEDVARLISFNVADFDEVEDDDLTFMQHMKPVIDNGIERLEAEIEEFDGFVDELGEHIDNRLQVIVDGTNPYELTSSSDNLSQYIRSHGGKQAISKARQLAQRAGQVVKDGFVAVLYRRSAGMLLARRLRAQKDRSATLVDRVLAFVSGNSPKRAVLSSLPFFYRQLFAGQTTMNEAFWVGREAQLAQARHAIENYKHGSHGAIFVTGDPHSGKSSLCQVIISRMLANSAVYRVHAPAGGTIDLDTFKAALQKEVKGRGGYGALLEGIPEGSVILIDALELWWERSDGGLAVIRQISQLIERFGRRCLFLINVGRQAFDYMRRFVPLTDRALAILECEPVSAEALKRMVTVRHESTGLGFRVGSRDEEELSQFALARLFSAHFDYSKGHVGAALRAWVTHIDKVEDSTLVVRPPRAPAAEVLDELRVEWVALLLQLVLHKQLTFERFARVTGIAPAELRRQLDTLRLAGLVVESRRRVLEVNGFISHHLIESLVGRGMLR